MEASTIGLLLTGLGVGAASGLLGIGGAIILIPVLMLVFGYTQSRAQGTSLGALLPPVGIFAAMQYYRNGMLDVRAAGLIAAGFVFGALGGASIVPYVPQIWLKRIFASLLVYVAARLAFADPNRKLGAVLPGLIAVGGLWVVYGVRRLISKKPPPPPPSQNPPPPPETEYYI